MKLCYRMGRGRAAVVVAAACLSTALPTSAGANVKFTRISTLNASTSAAAAMARAADGRLHLVFQTSAAGRGFSGLASISISANGFVGPQVQALDTWQTTQAGLVATPNGSLSAFFGAANPSLFSTVWGISSTNGGATWAAPVNVSGTGPNEALADSGDITAAMSNGTPVLALPHAGGLVMQIGLGPTAPNYLLTTASDGAMTDADLAVDAATHEVVAGWNSLAGAGRDYLQGAAPTIGKVQMVPGQERNAVIPSGRDKGAGVFAAYTTDGSHVRLLRYGGGSFAVGVVRGVSAKAPLGTATGLGGRIWVFWGSDNPSAIIVTRSNRAVTRFEPLQRLDPNAFSLYRLSGDGRLGPLDLFADEIPNAKTVVPAGNYYAHVLPVLSVTVSVSPLKNKKGKVVAHVVTATVTDAGDAVGGATVTIGAKKAKTNSAGVAKLTVSGASGKVKLTVTDAGYQTQTVDVKL